MKRLLAVVMTLLFLFVLIGCGASEDTPLPSELGEETTETDAEPETEEPVQEETPLEDGIYENERASVDICVNGDGYYSTYAKAKVKIEDGAIDGIVITDPVVLSFKVSSEYGGGVYVLNLEDGDYIADALIELSDQLKASGRDELAEQIDFIYELIIASGPYTYSPTRKGGVPVVKRDC